MAATHTSLSGKVCLVTGANSGIGKMTALGLARTGATVILVCRNSSKGAQAVADIKQQSDNEAVELLVADLSSQQSVRQLVQEFQQRYDQLHVLVNNAGSVFARRQLSVDGIEMTFALNHLASFLLTNLLLGTIKASAPARIVNVSSVGQFSAKLDLDDLQMEKHYSLFGAYANSKLANVLFTYALARRLAGTEVTVNCLHPGTVSTNIWGQPLPGLLKPLAKGASRLFGISPEEGAKTSLYLATSPEVADVTGKYFVKCKERHSAKASYDEALQERLWKASAALTQLSSTTV